MITIIDSLLEDLRGGTCAKISLIVASTCFYLFIFSSLIEDIRSSAGVFGVVVLIDGLFQTHCYYILIEEIPQPRFLKGLISSWRRSCFLYILCVPLYKKYNWEGSSSLLYACLDLVIATRAQISEMSQSSFVAIDKVLSLTQTVFSCESYAIILLSLLQSLCYLNHFPLKYHCFLELLALYWISRLTLN